MPGQRVALDPAVDVARAHLFGRKRPNANLRGVVVVPVRHVVPCCPGYPERNSAATGLPSRVPSPFTRLPGKAWTTPFYSFIAASGLISRYPDVKNVPNNEQEN